MCIDGGSWLHALRLISPVLWCVGVRHQVGHPVSCCFNSYMCLSLIKVRFFSRAMFATLDTSKFFIFPSKAPKHFPQINKKKNWPTKWDFLHKLETFPSFQAVFFSKLSCLWRFLLQKIWKEKVLDAYWVSSFFSWISLSSSKNKAVQDGSKQKKRRLYKFSWLWPHCSQFPYLPSVITAEEGDLNDDEFSLTALILTLYPCVSLFPHI